MNLLDIIDHTLSYIPDNPNKDVIFHTHFSSNWYESVGARKLLNSHKYFNPTIPFIVFTDVAINMMFEQGYNWNNLNSCFTYLIYQYYKDLSFSNVNSIIHFDADCIITAPLDEIISLITIENDNKVIGVRNNNDLGKAGKDNAITEFGIDVEKYINAGLLGFIWFNKERSNIIETWVGISSNNNYSFPFQEQSVINYLKKDLIILDPITSDKYYGISGLWGDNSHWDSWKLISVKNNKLFLNSPLNGKEKQVMILHQAGGHNMNKLSNDMFNNETNKFLENVSR